MKGAIEDSYYSKCGNKLNKNRKLEIQDGDLGLSQSEIDGILSAVGAIEVFKKGG